MTEAEWLACENTKPMLEYLDGKASNRKLCLFAAWCCRAIWSHMKKSSRRSVEVTERFLEGRASETVLEAAIAKATAAFEETSENTIEHHITFAASLGGMEEQFRCLAFGTFPPVRANGVVPTAERCSAQRPVAHPSGIRAEE